MSSIRMVKHVEAGDCAIRTFGSDVRVAEGQRRLLGVTSRVETLRRPDAYASQVPVGAGCWLGSAGEGEHVTTMDRGNAGSCANAEIRVRTSTGCELWRVAHEENGYGELTSTCSSGNEESVGRALKKTSVPRAEIFLTTKLDQKDHSRVLEALEISLAKLGVDYVDLYLMHWPMAFDESGRTLQPEESPTFVETWLEMEKTLDAGDYFHFAKGRVSALTIRVFEGKAKAIGVSNFSIKTLSELLAKATVVPAVNQVELHPCLPQHDLLAFCRAKGIQLTAYTPLGKHKFADDPTIRSIAEAHGPGVTSAHVLLSWGVQRGTAVIPKSLNPTRLQENLRVSAPTFTACQQDARYSRTRFEQLIELNTSEMDALNNLHKKPGMHRSMCGFHSQALGGSCFGWTYKQLGWEMTAGGIHL
ncbi:hypothetical protein NUW54_g5852 [Trametes sanguinea]|uniref:Uncharacterized protein n=1 Tax=Trametes sanguinea TaxID=158606 RepID=A0ACC1PW11_9APHY|nr:hypothetical protein NUW54_g5852 [Trametes sanguinea]